MRDWLPVSATTAPTAIDADPGEDHVEHAEAADQRSRDEAGAYMPTTCHEITIAACA